MASLHLPAWALLQSFVVMSRVTPGGGSAQNSLMTAAPSLPGLPVGKRSSTRRWLLNSPMLPNEAASADQSKSRASASNTSRSSQPLARAWTRTASAASSTRSGSTPAIR